MQAQAPNPAGVRAAVAVAGPACQVRVLGGGAGAAAFDRGGVDDPYRICPQVGVAGQDPKRALEQGQCRAQPFVVAGLTWQVRECAGQMPGTNRSQRASERIPSRTWAAAKVSSSASVSFGGRPMRGGLPSQSSIFTYIAVRRVLMSVVTNRSSTPFAVPAAETTQDLLV